MPKLPQHYYKLVLTNPIPGKGNEHARAWCECTDTNASEPTWSGYQLYPGEESSLSPDYKIRAAQYLDATCKTGVHVLLTEEIVEKS